jgi:hypothetical protein
MVVVICTDVIANRVSSCICFAQDYLGLIEKASC